MFFGQNVVKLDAKNRMTIPTKYRDELRAMCSGDMVATMHPEGYLLLFPRPRWMAFAQRFANVSQSMAWLKRLFLGNAAEMTLDGSGRLVFPAALTQNELVQLDGEVRLVGVGDYFEVWSAVAKDKGLVADAKRWKDAIAGDMELQLQSDKESIDRLIF